MADKITNIKQLLLKNISRCLQFNFNKNENESKLLDEIAKKLKENEKMILLVQNYDSDSKFIDFIKKANQLCEMFNALLFIEKRADLCKICDTSGIILNKNSMNLKNAKEIIDKDKLFGLKIDDDFNQIEEFDFILVDNINVATDKIKTIKLIKGN